MLLLQGFKPGTRRQKGQTLAEVEQQEGGPVKESLVGMAAVQRALRRKKQQGGQAAPHRSNSTSVNGSALLHTASVTHLSSTGL